MGGLLIETYGIMPLFLFSVLVFIITSLIFKIIKYESKKEGQLVSFHEILVDLKNGIKILKTDKVIFSLIFTWMGIQTFFAVGPMSLGWPVFSERILNAGPQGYGVLVASVSFSSLIGSLIIGQWGSKFKKGKLIMIGYLWGAIGMIIFSFSSDLIIATLIVFLWNFCFPLINIAFYTSILERGRDEDLGKIFGIAVMISTGLTPISTIMTGYIMEAVSVTLPFLMFGISFIFCFLVIYLNKESRNLI